MTRVMRLGLESKTRKLKDVVEGGTVEREYASDGCFEGGLIYPFGKGRRWVEGERVLFLSLL